MMIKNQCDESKSGSYHVANPQRNREYSRSAQTELLRSSLSHNLFDFYSHPLEESFIPVEPDPLTEVSKSLVSLPPRQGQLYAFLSVFSGMAKQGCVAIAEGMMPLPPNSFRCKAPLASLRSKYSKRERSYSSGCEVPAATLASLGDVEIQEIEPMPKSSFGTPEDTEQRLVYAYTLAFLLQEQVLATDELGKISSLPIFSCRDMRVPSISILRFVQRLFKYLPCTKEMYVVALIFIDRVLAYNPGMCVTASNVHRLIFISMLVAAKFFDDLFYANFYMAKVGGVSVQEVLELEVEFLAAIRFSLYVDQDLFNTYLTPFEQLVGVLRILPLDSTEADPVPPFRKYPPYGKWSWTSVDELFYHILTEKQKPYSSVSSASSASMLSTELDLSEDAEWNHVRLDSKSSGLNTRITKESLILSTPSSESSEDESEDELQPQSKADDEKAGDEKPRHKRHHRHHHHHHHHHRHHHGHSSEKRQPKLGSDDDGTLGARQTTTYTIMTTATTTTGSSSSSATTIKKTPFSGSVTSTDSAAASSSATARQARGFANVGRIHMNGIRRVGRFRDSRKIHRGSDSDRGSHSV